MKATKLLGSIALTAALAMGTVPAFASVNAPTDWLNGTDQGIGGAGVSTDNKMITNLTNTNDNKKQGTGSTAVKATVFDADMQVTIPLQLSVAFASVGSELTCPSDGAYAITNNGTDAVKITNINANSSQFTLAELTSSNITNTSPQSTRYIAMTLDFGNNQKVDLAAAKAANGDLTGLCGDINLPANSPTAIKLAGKTNTFSTPMTVGYQMSTIMDITYTIETA